MGAEAIGLYQICISVLILLIAITSGGLPLVLSRKIAEFEVENNKKKQGAFLTVGLIIGISLSSIIMAICYGLGDKISILFADDRCVPLFKIMLPALLSSTIYAVFRAWFWGRKKFFAFSFTEFLDDLLKLVFVALFTSGLISATVGATGIAIAFTAADVVCAVILIIFFFVGKGKLSKPQGFLEISKSALPVSVTHLTAGVIGALTALVLPQKLIESGIVANQATAMFGQVSGMALPLLMAPTTITGSLAVVLIPEIAELHAKSENTQLLRKYQNSIVFAVLITTLFFVLYTPLGENITTFLFKDSASGIYISFSAVIMFAISLHQVTMPIVNALGMESRTFFHYMIGIFCLLPCLFFLPQHIGIYAMAVGSGICFAVSAILNMILLRKKLGKSPKTFGKCLQIVGFAVPAILISYFLKNILSPLLPNIAVLLVCGFVSMTIYILPILVFKIVTFESYFKFFVPSKWKTKKLEKRKNKSLKKKIHFKTQLADKKQNQCENNLADNKHSKIENNLTVKKPSENQLVGKTSENN